MEEPQKIALVLTGGGARGAYQAGFLRGLADIGPEGKSPFSILTGCSVGAINAAYLACYPDSFQDATKNLWDMWANLRPNGVFTPRTRVFFRNSVYWFAKFILGSRKAKPPFSSILNNSPLRSFLSTRLDFDSMHGHLAAGKLHGVAFSLTDYTRGNSTTFFQGAQEIKPWESHGRWGRRSELTVDHVVASAGLPILFEPVKIGNRYYGDGSIRLTAPLSPAIHLGAEKILVVTTHGHENLESAKKNEATGQQIEGEKPSFGVISATLLRSIFSDSLHSDLERLHTINQLVSSGSTEPHLKSIPAIEFRPTKDLGKIASECCSTYNGSFMRMLKFFGALDSNDHAVLSYLSFEPSYTVPLLEVGYQDAQAAKQQLKEFLGI